MIIFKLGFLETARKTGTERFCGFNLNQNRYLTRNTVNCIVSDLSSVKSLLMLYGDSLAIWVTRFQHHLVIIFKHESAWDYSQNTHTFQLLKTLPPPPTSLNIGLQI